MTLDKRLAYLRKRERMSQAEVAEKLDVSRQAVSRWESGDSKPSIENLQSLCKLYHMSLDQMFATDDDIPSPVVLMDSNEEKKTIQDIRRKRNNWIRWLALGVVVVALLICIFFMYKKEQKENTSDLHDLQGEEVIPEPVVPKFDLGWE